LSTAPDFTLRVAWHWHFKWQLEVAHVKRQLGKWGCVLLPHLVRSTR